jgi:DNA-binding MurR/RpiR family transcriptional regulator
MNTTSIQADLKRLTKKEKKIYYSIKQSFPATSHESAMDVALQGGVKWQFISK